MRDVRRNERQDRGAGAAVSATPALRCHGCGAEVRGEPYPFRCPRAAAGGDADHVLMPEGLAAGGPFADPACGQPFARYRGGLYSYALALARGMSDADFVALVAELDAAVAAVDGHGFRVTPFAPSPALAERLGLATGEVWVKDETGNVSGSHKARHLFGVLLALEVAERTGLTTRAESDRRGLAIASCGNAALAAAVIARATQRRLRVFIPPDADANVVARLNELGVSIAVCPREPGRPGDPCVHGFHEAIAAGALPFCCQGNENGLTIEGGMTLAWEMTETLAARGVTLDRVFVQVGGGALASAVGQGLERGRVAMPRLHAVQTEGAWPLRRAYERVRARALRETGPQADAAAADRMREPQFAVGREAALAHACAHRSRYMWPWEQEPRSVAHGILDDETYDWFELTRVMVESGGWPVTVAEPRLIEARDLAHAAGVRADATGAAGLAGLIELRASGALAPTERVAVLLTGVER
jgi:threonine synthase